MRFLLLAFFAALSLLASLPAAAQDRAWVQIEAHPTLTEAQTRVRAYSQLLENVNGYGLSSGWYAIALGPYDRATAEAELARLRGQGLIPGDSYVEFRPGAYAQQFWPVGADTLTAAAAPPPLPGTGDLSDNDTDAPDGAPVAPVVEAAAPPPVPAEETLAEARASERQLDRPAREALQVALQWFGFYAAGIDGAFGPGTRGAMEAWQIDRGLEPTGVLTTSQRAALLREYRDDLDSFGFRTIVDSGAGIEIEIPAALVDFDRYDYPFAHYEGADGWRLLLISQEGDRRTLTGLYDIMQTLEIVPLEGERERGRDSFVLTGQSPALNSYTYAELRDGAVRGYTLVWDPANQDRAERILPRLEASFAHLEGTIDPDTATEEAEQSVDLLAGLEIRRADLTRSGFFIDADGTVLTTVEVAGQCTRLLIDGVHEAEITLRDDALGLLVLRSADRLAPLAYARFSPEPARLRSDIAVAGFPFGGALGSASMSFGTLADIRGLGGEETLQRLDLDTEESEAGGPVLDSEGAVLGMVMPGRIDGRAMPDGVSFALRGDRLAQALAAAGLTPALFDGGTGTLAQDRLARLGADMTVTVSCWN